MYQKPFFIKTSVGNNAFSYEKRTNKELFVPNLIKIKNFSQIELGKHVVFEDFDFNGNLNTCSGLKNFYEIDYLDKKIYLFDNHNHAYYFWYLARNYGIINDNNILFHIDEHSDMRDPENYLLKPNSYGLKQVFDYTNYFLNVGNYIIPAIKEGLIGEVVQIRNTGNLEEYLEKCRVGIYLPRKEQQIILNLDLDFFQPDLDFIDYELKKKVVLDITKKATVITVATSPFFINQEIAIKVFKDLFSS